MGTGRTNVTPTFDLARNVGTMLDLTAAVNAVLSRHTCTARLSSSG